MNPTKKAIIALLVGWSAYACALTQVQFTGLESNAPLARILTLVVVPPSNEQLVNTNLVVLPNLTIKPTTNGYPIVSVQAADYDVYTAGLKVVFRISVPDTNVVCQWYALLKGGLTTYNYTNPATVFYVSNYIYTGPTNWPAAAPTTYGQSFSWNSNGTLYAVQSKVNALAWTKTNLVSAP